MWYNEYNLDDRWNMDKITMNLLVPKNKLNSENKYYILGDIV